METSGCRDEVTLPGEASLGTAVPACGRGRAAPSAEGPACAVLVVVGAQRMAEFSLPLRA